MILFLDFDGVLHPVGCVDGTDAPLFSRVAALWEILRACPDVRVVFSTSWRELYKFDEMTALVTRDGGEDLVHRFVGSTPNLEAEGFYGRRNVEIRSWLEGHDPAVPWLALDDMLELFAGEEGEEGDYANLHLVDHQTGLTDADVAEIIAIIERSS
ncbi:MAG: hypothetical protein KJ589_17285 [Proteobacteria bacterium]|nr:hypothetical protein [Pseudomonadota bacterium]